MPLVFEWDARKARTNERKHGIGFEEAASVFGDPLARIFSDEIHSANEAREIIIGHSSRAHLLLVCFMEAGDERVRVFSARKATKEEQRDYEANITG